MESESKKESSDGEDIPSDFFDDFTKEDFMDGLSVIDSWNNEEKPRSRRIDEEAVNSVNDLRELIAKEDKQDSNNPLDDYIKPGSRRDPSKTQEAIKRDKESKVKEFLAKHLESADDLCPPGTELDDYYDESISEKNKIKEKVDKDRRLAKEKYEIDEELHESPFKYNEPVQYRHRDMSPRYRRESPMRLRYRSPGRHRRDFSPRHRHESPMRYRHGFHREERYPFPRRGRHYSPHRHRSPRFSMRRPPHNSHWSPRRSPGRPRRYRQSPELRRSRSRSRSPYKRPYSDKRSRSPSKHGVEKDDFLYPEKYKTSACSTPMQLDPQYSEPGGRQYEDSSYSYAQPPSYTGYNEPYFPSQLETPGHLPQPVPAPIAHAPQLNTSMVPAPCMVPAPMQTQVQTKTSIPIPINPLASQILESTPASPYDALAKLVADGKLSHEDYLKLAPNKGVTTNMDPKERVTVLNRCSIALSKLGNLKLPNRLMINNMLIGQEQKTISPKYPSPLKRQSAVEFHFSKMHENSTVTQRNKQIVESIMWALSLDKVVAASKKRTQKDVQEVSVQTSKGICEVCEIRETTKYCDASTSTEPEYFSSSVHTQVIEEDLFSSKAVFNPSGSSSGGTTMSIAHLTPAQLVSQLAARAKTLKQTDQPQSSPRENRPNYDFDYDYSRRGGNHYQNPNYNYRY